VDIDLTGWTAEAGLNPTSSSRSTHGVVPCFRMSTARKHCLGWCRTVGRTAWTDKHRPTSGPTGPSGKVEDFYGRKINSNPCRCRRYRLCHGAPFPIHAPDDGWTNSFDDVNVMNSLHVQEVDQIDGYTHDRRRSRSTDCFGTNFQP